MKIKTGKLILLCLCSLIESLDAMDSKPKTTNTLPCIDEKTFKKVESRDAMDAKLKTTNTLSCTNEKEKAFKKLVGHIDEADLSGVDFSLEHYDFTQDQLNFALNRAKLLFTGEDTAYSVIPTEPFAINWAEARKKMASIASLAAGFALISATGFLDNNCFENYVRFQIAFCFIFIGFKLGGTSQRIYNNRLKIIAALQDKILEYVAEV